MELNNIGEIIESRYAQLQQLELEYSSIESRIAQIENDLERVSELSEIVQLLLQNSQSVVVKSITDLVNRAFAIIFGGSYEFDIEFETKRGKVVANIWFTRDGAKIHPSDAVGGGVVDVVSLVLRLAFWSLRRSTAPVIVFDEPLKFLSVEYRELAAEILHTFSEELKTQIIMVTHIEELFDSADRIFRVRLENGESKIE